VGQVGGLPEVHAQAAGDLWQVPTNLSQSGAASDLAVIPQPDDGLRVFWWDEFDGVTMMEGAPQAWSEPVATPIILVVQLERPTADGRTTELVPVSAMPALFGDLSGRSHAFWLGEADEETGATPLLSSRLESDSITWSFAREIAETAVGLDLAVDPAGALHLVYVRNQNTDALPSGIYYRQSVDGGANWSAAVPIYTSRYVRLLSPEAVHLDVAAPAPGAITVVWDDPQDQLARVARSEDGGATWLAPIPVDAESDATANGRLLTRVVDDVATLSVVWQDGSLGASCTLKQAAVTGTYTDTLGTPIALDEGLGCPDPASLHFATIGEDRTLMMVGGLEGRLTLAAWDGDEWSASQSLSVYFSDTSDAGLVYLSDVQPLVGSVVLTGTGTTQPQPADALLVMGLDEKGDVWAAAAELDLFDFVYAPPPIWTDPERLTEDESSPDLPAAVIDEEGRLHLLWSEATAADGVAVLRYARRENDRWTRATTVLRSPMGGATSPVLAAQGELLHALWSGGARGQIWYSHAFLQDAYAESGWLEPVRLSECCSLPDTAAGGHPDIVGLGGVLHAVFAVPVNEGRGIYYTSSVDEGETWEAVSLVFDAVGEGWAVVDNPKVAVDYSGALHVVWEQPALSPLEPALGAVYARSDDGGESWSEPATLAEGDIQHSEVVVGAPGEVHLLWQDASGVGTWWHRYAVEELGSSDSEQGEWAGWTRPAQVVGLGRVPGPLGVVADGVGHIHLLGWRELDGTQAELVHTIWTGDRWEQQEALPLAFVPDRTGAGAALHPLSGQLSAVLSGALPVDDDQAQNDLWYTRRLVSLTVGQPAVAVTAVPTPTPTPTPVVGPIETPTPVLTDGPPPASGGLSGLPLALLMGGGLASVIVVGAFGVRLVRNRRR